MFCPKCGASLKDEAKFCHVCGFSMSGAATPPPPQPQQQPQYQQPVSEQPASEQPSGTGFDISKTPVSAWIIAGAATLGMISTWLPWKVFRGWGWGFGYFDFGYLIFIIFLGIVGVAIAGDAMKMKPEVKSKLIGFGGVAAGGFCFIDFILALTSRYLAPGFGLIMALLCSVAIILFGFKIIKLK